MMTKEEKEEVYTNELPSAQEIGGVFTKEESEELQSLLSSHTEKMNELIDDFSKQFDSWKEKYHKKTKARG